jgi:hypothetical protein
MRDAENRQALLLERDDRIQAIARLIAGRRKGRQAA